MKTKLISLACMILQICGSAKSNISSQVPNDWMLNNKEYQASIKEINGNLVISNGLIERVFKGGTTVRLNNLMTGEGMLRSVRPEAEIEINHIQIPIGGLTGQPVHNYLLPEWLDDVMTPDSMAFQYDGYKVSEIKPRFTWKPRKEWMASNPAWPAKGKELILQYKANEQLLHRLESRFTSDENRESIFKSNFIQSIPAGWNVITSASNKVNSFENEGKSGEILIPANTCAYAERRLPDNTEVLITKIHPGTDKATSWGPGMVWVFNNKTVKTYLRTADAKFGVTGAGMEYEMEFSGYRPGEPVYLKMQRTNSSVICSFSYDGNKWTELKEITIPKGSISQCVRVGKMDLNGSNTEFTEKGESGRCRIDFLNAYGGIPTTNKNMQFAYLKDIEVNIHYEIYDGIPLISKWISIKNKSNHPVCINTYKSEILAVMEPENATVFNRSFTTPNITIESDFVHANEQDKNDEFANLGIQHHVHWKKDPKYTTQVDWLMNIPCLLESYPEYGPAYDIKTGGIFSSHRIWELFHDTWDKERKTLQIRKMYRIAAPWIAENPIFMHVRNADNESVKKAIDQCAEVGFEMVIMTFWSGVNLEDDSPENLKRMKDLADYAHSKGIALGGYSLLASRSIDKENDVIMPEGKTPQFGASPCIESKWGQEYMRKLKTYFKETGQDILEHDGSYPGDECASTSHPGHKGLDDSQWKQYQTIKEFYQNCKSQGIFLNIPDWYFMNGQNKTGMGYRETNWSLPRKQQEIIERQNIYDGTWLKTPSMGWMMVPLVEYHGGGKEATIEPLKEHLPHYEMRLANNFGAGVIACYRGPQLYDAPETKSIVKKWVDFYKEHRAILNSDIIHLRRADGSDWDGFIHVNPELKEKGLMMVYNPLSSPIKKNIRIPLYYTGLKDKVTIRKSDGSTDIKQIDRDYSISMEIEIPAYYCNWYVFE